MAASLAVFGLRAVMSRNVDLIVAHEENARLAVDNERTRFARDLHDILGHSLTVITVKAELAQKLLDVDLERARAEIADLERLSRDALADVRRAVEGYRDITLPDELVRARDALTAAEIEAELPELDRRGPTELRELFAWTVREGVTNVIRHSGATRCEVRLTPTSAEVRDDGPAPCRPRATAPGWPGCANARPTSARPWSSATSPPAFSLSVVHRSRDQLLAARRDASRPSSPLSWPRRSRSSAPAPAPAPPRHPSARGAPSAPGRCPKLKITRVVRHLDHPWDVKSLPAAR